MHIIRESIKKKHLQMILDWRSTCPETLRTPFDVSIEEQEKWYMENVSNRNSKTRYFIFHEKNGKSNLGYGGVEFISLENRNAEISLLVNPDYQGKGYGKNIVDNILTYSFFTLNLESVHGECYYCGNVGFWEKISDKYKAKKSLLHNRKYWNGKYYDSFYFTITKKDFKECTNVKK